MTWWLILASIAVGIASIRRSWICIAQLPIVIVAVNVLHDPIALSVATSLTLVPPLSKIVRVLLIGKDLKLFIELLGYVAKMVVLAVVATMVLSEIYLTQEVLENPWLFACASIAIALLILSIARVEADGFPELPRALEVAGFAIPAIVSMLCASNVGIIPLALTLLAPIARALGARLLNERISLAASLSLLVAALCLATR